MVVDLEKLISQIVADNATKQERPTFLLRVQQDILEKLSHNGPGKVNLMEQIVLTVLDSVLNLLSILKCLSRV